VEPLLIMNQLIKSYNSSLNYPKNLIQINALECNATEYFAKLNDRASSVFTDEKDAAVDFLDLHVEENGSMYANGRTLTLISHPVF
jgi:hypothetical protein